MDTESRRSKFSPEEINRLLQLIAIHIEEIESRTPTSAKEKLERELVWASINTRYNFGQKKKRTLKMLKSKWSDLKTKAKNEKMEDNVLRGKVLNIMNKIKNTRKNITNAVSREINSVSTNSDSRPSTSNHTVQATSFQLKGATGARKRPLEEAARAESTKHIKIENGENKQNINVNPNYKRTLLELKEELEKIKQQMIELEHDVENENNE